MGCVVFRYDGFGWLETMLAGMACYNAAFTENAFVYLPYGDARAVQTLARNGVRRISFDDGTTSNLTYNDGPDAETLRHLGARNFANPRLTTDSVVLVEGAKLHLSDFWRSRVHGSLPITECSLEQLPDLGGSKLLTTDWRAAAVGYVMGMKVVLVSGPAYPRWLDVLSAGSRRVRIFKVSDRGRHTACPCSSVDHCHRRDLADKPCVLTIPQEVLGALKDTT